MKTAQRERESDKPVCDNQLCIRPVWAFEAIWAYFVEYVTQIRGLVVAVASRSRILGILDTVLAGGIVT